MAHYIEKMAKMIGQRLQELCSEDDLISLSREEKSRMVNWDQFLEDLNSVEGIAQKRAILEQPITRKVKVKKNLSENRHRTYTIEDNIIQKALRRSPPSKVIQELEMISPSYGISKRMHEIIKKLSMEDEEWTEIKRILYSLTVSKMYNLTDLDIKKVFKLRHGWREDTLIMMASRKNPPLTVVKEMLKVCRESIAIVDTPLHDWIPMHYSIAYGAKPEVTEAMIPTKDDFDSLISLPGFNLLEQLDIYNRTPLHWAVFYDAPLVTINLLKKRTTSNMLETKDDLKKRPFELAIYEGTSMDIIETLLPDSITTFVSVEKNMVRSLIHKTRRLATEDKSTIDEFHDNVTLYAEGNSSDVQSYDTSSKCIPYLAEELADKKYLQNMLITKSCQTMSTFVTMLDFYVKILLVISFHESSVYFLGKESSSLAQSWLYVLVVTASFTLAREVLKMYIEGLRWFINFWNIVDISTYILVLWCGIKIFANTTSIESNLSTLIIWTTAFVWANVLFFLRKTCLRISIVISGFIKIVQDLIPFLVLSSLILIAFGHMFMVESLASGKCANEGNDDQSFCTFHDSLFTNYASFVSGVEIRDLTSTRMMRTISIAFGFFISIILFNIIIAIVNNSWDSVAHRGKEVFWNYRLTFAHDLHILEELLPCNNWNDTQWVTNLTWSIDGAFSTIVLALWPRANYWGEFDSIIDRTLTTKYGSLYWQVWHDDKLEKNSLKRLMTVAKLALLLVFIVIVLFTWFIAGLLSCGILWPKPMRRFIFTTMMIFEKSEVDEMKDDMKMILEMARIENGDRRRNFNNIETVELISTNSDNISLSNNSFL